MIFNIDHIIRLIGKGENYQIDLTGEHVLTEISKDEYERIKGMLDMKPDTNSIYEDRGLTVL